jgi:hypothetical protein
MNEGSKSQGVKLASLESSDLANFQNYNIVPNFFTLFKCSNYIKNSFTLFLMFKVETILDKNLFMFF